MIPDDKSQNLQEFMLDEEIPQVIQDFIASQNDIEIDRCTKGGFGILFFGKRVILGDRVALKFYHLENSIEDHIEPNLLKVIRHRNILEIYDARIIGDSYAYYLTPEISGGDLQEYIERNALSTDASVKIIQGILTGLNELHSDSRNLVHRDIKTANILIEQISKNAFLSDFGTVKKIPPDKEYTSASIFTPFYQPPEVIIYDQYSKQSDLYQVGIVLYQCLGGFFPINNPIEWLECDESNHNKFKSLEFFEQNSFFDKYIDGLIIKGKLINLDSLPYYINKKMKRIIKKATTPDLLKRFNSCTEFLKALYDYQKDAKNWWLDKAGIIHACSHKKNTEYRIYSRKNEFVVESQKEKSMWRKKIGFDNINDCINYIETI